LAVKVTDWPVLDGFNDDVTEVVVEARCLGGFEPADGAAPAAGTAIPSTKTATPTTHRATNPTTLPGRVPPFSPKRLRRVTTRQTQTE